MCGWSESHKQSQRLRQAGELCLCERSTRRYETTRPLLAMPRAGAGDSPETANLKKNSGSAPRAGVEGDLAATLRTGAGSRQRRAASVEGPQGASRPGSRGRGHCSHCLQRRSGGMHPGGGVEDQTLESVSRLAGVYQVGARKKGAAIRWQGTPTGDR